VIIDLLSEGSTADFSHPLIGRRTPVKKVRVIVVGASRGLCGGYNTNIHRRLEALLREKAQEYPHAAVELVLLGRKPAEYCRRRSKSYIKSYEQLPDDANKWPVEELCKESEDAFVAGDVDEVVLLYTRFKSAISQTVMTEKILPMDGSPSPVMSKRRVCMPRG